MGKDVIIACDFDSAAKTFEFLDIKSKKDILLNNKFSYG